MCRGQQRGGSRGWGKIGSAAIALHFILCACMNDEEGLFFPVFSSSCKHWSCWVNAELSQALCEHHGCTSPGEGRNSRQVGRWQLKAAWGSVIEMSIAQILLFILKCPPVGFPALNGMLRPRHPRVSPLCT